MSFLTSDFDGDGTCQNRLTTRLMVEQRIQLTLLERWFEKRIEELEE